MEEAFPCRGSGTNAACAPLLVLRGSSPPPCPVTEVAWADSSCSASPRGTALRQSGSPSPFRSSGRPGFPVRVGCSRTVMVPRWVLVPLVFQRPSFEDRLSSLVLRSFLRPNASQDSPSKPLFAGDKASLRESLSAAGEPSCVERVNPSWRTKSGGNRCLSSLLRRGLSRGPWVLPFDLLADTKKGQACLKPKKIDFPKFTLYPPHLQTIVDNGMGVKTPRIRRCKSTQAKSC